MSENLKAAAFAAGLSDKERAEVDSLNKALGVHRELSNLPQVTRCAPGIKGVVKHVLIDINNLNID